MGYVSITKLSLLIQDKLNKLNAGNLSEHELDELKELSHELNERIVILHYKSKELALLKEAGDIIAVPKVEIPIEEKQETPFKINIEPIAKEKTPEPVFTEPGKPATVFDAPGNLPEVNQPVVEVKEHSTTAQKNVPVESAEVKTQSPTLSLVERMQKTKVHDLNTVIGLNQKFLFMNFLFEGENNSYNDAIHKLNNMPTAADARHYIRELAYLYNWNFEDENVVMFTEFVERRYL